MDRVKAAEAARVLGVNRSTISRWIKKHPALADSDGLVCVDALRKHRDEVINPGLQTRTAKKAEPKTEPGAVEDVPPAAPPGPAPDTGPSLNDHRARRAAADAVDAELDLAERLGLTLRRDQVEAAIADAGQLMSQLAGQLARDSAERIARLDDTRAVERALEDLFRDFLKSASEHLEAAAKSSERANAA